MCSPIYSNNPPEDGYDSKLEKHFISLLSDATVSDINAKLTFVKHGIYLFIQYKEIGYVVNSFPEEVFWNMINGLYRLIHDCSNEILELFLQVVKKDGFQAIKPFKQTDDAKVQKFEDAMEFVKDIENMRIVHYHNMKTDSETDKARVRKVEKRFQKILNNATGPISEAEWEHCITWIYKNCENIQELLEERIKFLQTEATEEQKNRLCENYYSCIRAYYNGIMFEIIRDILRKKRKKFNDSIRIQSLVNENKEDIANKAIMLIQNAVCRADPYIAALQAADIILTQKKQI